MARDKKNISGNIPAVVTPFDADGRIDFDAFVRLIEWHLSRGVDGICVAGDNGESWSLSFDERKKLSQEAARVIDGGVPLVVGATATSNQESAENAVMAAEIGADAILLMPQTYVLKASQSELTARFALVAEAADIPIIFYNSPRRAGIDVSMDELAAVCDAAPIIGIKESSRDFFHATHLLKRFGKKIAVLMGPCHYILPGIALGAAGFIATGPELLPAESMRRVIACGRERPGDEYAKLHYQLTGIYETLMGLGTWPASLKAALVLVGQPAGIPREPILPLDAEATAKLRSALARLGAL
ncbi:MAG: 2,4-dihydroxyhept-2-ene-1,7-dioic acid aldolase [Acidobacteriota bacterium]|nr:MAG: 2,4-dihydroxyhept-2-ene-1,7-dioic acid aldolase [Acidobacteriota bacterium]